MRSTRLPLHALVLFGLAGSTCLGAETAPGIDFDRDVRPILTEHCFACHGPDAGKRKAGFRLDTKPGAFAELNGHRAIVPGKPDESPLVDRVRSDDPDEMMPPPEARKRKPFSPADADLLRRWVAEGAVYKGHWAFEKPLRTSPPRAEALDTIDRFILARLAEQGLKPSPPADRVTLIRRLSFDLIGLPPTPAEVDAFVNDRSANAYEKLVDRLLASHHFGERMAVAWLDWVRYADTAGYHSDNHRDVSPYRDYVIEAFNKNKPFDRFTVEQIAGDLLPAATNEQRIGSGYNRMLMTTQEGGSQAKEYIAKYAADRVRNASTVWLGATLGCAECHDHKFDPYTTRDFYRFAAFFADIQEVPVGDQPVTRLPTPDQQARLDAIDAKAKPLKTALDTATAELKTAQAAWENEVSGPDLGWVTLKPKSAKSKAGATLKVEPDGTIKASGKAGESDVYTLEFNIEHPAITGLRIEVLPDPKLPAQGPGRAVNGNFVLHEFTATTEGKPVAFASASATYSQPGWDVAGAIDGKAETGWAIAERAGKPSHAVFQTMLDIKGDKPVALTIQLDQHYGTQHVIGKFRIAATEARRPVKADSVPQPVREALSVEPSKRSKPHIDTIAAYYRTIAPILEPIRQELATLTRERDAILASAPATLVSTSGMPRTMRILPRGNWLDESGAEVTPAVPAFLGPEVAGRRATRLDLANWLVSQDNPLVARVFVNRLWKLAFGQGLVSSLEDFGSQGASPTHPELLDDLAISFRDEGWDIKRMLKRMLMTTTYQQSSLANEHLRQADPYNRWLARQGRFRLDSEFIRDDMLVLAGLLTPKVGGPSVKPYQPAGYWSHLNFPKREYSNDHGEALYRRSLYTYWQRSFLHPSLLAFDAPTREECTASRSRSNTPIQALVLLNDPIFVEGARAFAERIIKEAKDDNARLTAAYRHALSREPRPAERPILIELLNKHREQFRKDAKATDEFLHVGERPVPKDIDPVELASWTSVTRAILNLHETITRN
jgi:hypothetical protein